MVQPSTANIIYEKLVFNYICISNNSEGRFDECNFRIRREFSDIHEDYTGKNTLN